jgi:hypothetical protein
MFPPTEDNILQQHEAQGHLGQFPMNSSAAVEEPIDTGDELSPEDLAFEEERKAEQEVEDGEENAIIRELIKKAEDEDLDLRVTPLCGSVTHSYFNNIQNIFLDPVARLSHVE